MIHFDVNWLAVVLAAVASMAFGMAWYMALGKHWMAALGKSEEEIQASLSGGVTPFAWAAISQLVMAYFLVILTPALMETTTWYTGALTGIHMWVGFVITTMIINHRYQGSKWSLTMIDGAHFLGALIVQGVVIGLFG